MADRTMEDKLKTYVRSCFAEAPDTARAAEVCEEICSNVVERYHDLLKSGARPAEAYDIACRSVGNVQDILSELEDEPIVIKMAEKNARMRGIWIGVGVGMYLVGVALVILIAGADQPAIGAACMLACFGIATAMCVYGAVAYPKVVTCGARAMSEEEAEDFQQWRAEKITGEEKKRKYNGVLWPLIAAVYFVVSFLTGAWGITWVIFLIGEAVIKLLEILEK